MKRLLLLGAGHAHLEVLRVFGNEPPPGVAITLLTPYADFTYSGMVPGFLAGHYALADCTVPLAPLVARAAVNFIEGWATRIDAADRQVELRHASGTIEVVPYDFLSIDTGPEMDRDAIAGAREHAHFVRPIEVYTRSAAGLVAAPPPELIVVGGGAGGVEVALALHHRLRGRARVSLVTGGGPPVAAQSKALQLRVRRALQRRGVTVYEAQCVEVAADEVALDSGEQLACDVALLAIGTRAPQWLADSGLALDAHGFIATHPTLQSISHAEVYAAGDVASRSDAPRPKSGVYAVRAGPPLALNLRRAIEGAPLQRYMPQRRSLNLLACGDRSAIASWGDWSFEGRWVWRWKDHIDRAFIARYRLGSANS